MTERRSLNSVGTVGSVCGNEEMRVTSQSTLTQFRLNSSNSVGPIRSISSLKAHRGPYSRPSILDRDSRYSPYAKKPMLIRAKKVANEIPSLNLTSTAERIINTLANCSTPVVDIKKSPIDSLKSLKPEFPVIRRDRSGPPVVRSAFEATPGRSIISPIVQSNLVPQALTKTSSPLNVEGLIGEIFPSRENVSQAEGEQFCDYNDGNSEEVEDLPEDILEFFDPSGKIKLANVRFEGWSLNKYKNSSKDNENGEFSESSSEDEGGNRYIKQVEFEKGKTSERFKKVETIPGTIPAVSTSVQKSKWECPTCLVQVEMDESVCPCCVTTNPNLKSIPSIPASSSEPINSSPFSFGFNVVNDGATAIHTRVTTSSSSFKFGEQQPVKSSSLLRNFKLGFNPPVINVANTNTETSKPVFPTTFSFGISGSNQTASSTFGLNDNVSKIMGDNGVETSRATKSEIHDFAKKSAKEEIWECPMCMVFNQKSQAKCQCCQESQPKFNPQPNTEVGEVELSAPPLIRTSFSSPSTGSMASATSIISKQQPGQIIADRRKMVFGLKPEDEESLEVASTEHSKPNPFTGLALSSVPKPLSSENEKIVAKSTPMNEIWACKLCTSLNKPNVGLCTGCGEIKPQATQSSMYTSSQPSSKLEQYTFEPFYGVPKDSGDAGKPELASVFNLGTKASQPVLSVPLRTSTSEFNFSAPVPLSSTPSAVNSLTLPFKFGTPLSGEGLKRKANENTESESGNSIGFSFDGTSEPKLKLRASGVEAPIPAPNIGLKSGSVLDVLKKPGFDNVDKPDDKRTALPTNPAASLPSPSFSFPTSVSTPAQPSTLTAPNNVFQFGANLSNPPTAPAFSFGVNNPTSAPTSAFGTSVLMSPPTNSQQQIGFRFEQPGMSAPGQQMAPFVPPNFSVTPNLNFGAAPAWDPSNQQPFTFQGTPGQGGASTPRKIRKAVRRNR